jgi:hypothetical protein
MQRSKVTGRYNYLNAAGQLLYWKERIEPGANGRSKDFRFYHGLRESGRGGEPVLMYLPEVIAAKAVIITEGEKQAYLLKTWGLVATTLDSGANSKITPAMVEVLAGKRIAILRDNDAPGLVYAESIAKATKGKAESMRIVLLPDLPEKGDICDWTGDKAQLLEIIKATPVWVPPPEEAEKRRVPRPMNTGGYITEDMISAAKAFPIESLIEFAGGKAFCFVHEDKTPSLVHYKAKNRAHCFGCGADMNSIDVLIKRDKMGFKDAVKALQC